MEKQYIIFVVTLMAIIGAEAQVPFLGGCGNVGVKQDFVPTSYLGRWYEQAKYFAIFQFGGKCVTADYGAINGTTISVYNAQTNIITGAPTTITGYATLKYPTQPNKADLIVVFPTTPFSRAAPYQVLETDYNNYAVVYSCVGTGFLSFKFVWILTRVPNVSDAIMNTAYSVLDRNKIPRGFLIKTDQVNCNRT